MKRQLERIYLASGPTNLSWKEYFTRLEQSAYQRLREKLKERMVLRPAPFFALKDIAGKVVSLSDFKGKVVVIDFWATWCGPCIASFPTMQAAVKKYKDSTDVAFLFIDTWENDANRVQKVTEFFRNNNYDFHVLYDAPNGKEQNDFVVVSQFGVEGIPTKIVIDPNGNIRFVSVGYNSRPEETLKELSMMITLAKENSEKNN
jgi:thiol-disulfide isomerase/thioredoxin